MEIETLYTVATHRGTTQPNKVPNSGRVSGIPNTYRSASHHPNNTDAADSS